MLYCSRTNEPFAVLANHNDPEAEGTDEAPRLAGQNAAYVIGQLAHFRRAEGYNSVMTGVARCVKRDQARSVAAYLQSR